MSNCCDRPIRQTSHCVTQVEPVRNPTANISLPMIERAIDCRDVLVPCAFTLRAVNTAQFCLSCIPDNDSPSSQRQFAQCLRSKGLLHCEGAIQWPRLWVEALEESIDRNGENFSQIYISKLRTHAPAA